MTNRERLNIWCDGIVKRRQTVILTTRLFNFPNQQWQVRLRKAQTGSRNAMMLDVGRDMLVMGMGRGKRWVIRMWL